MKYTSAQAEQMKKEWFEINSPLGKELGYPECCIKAFCDQPPEILKATKITKEDQMRYKAGCIDGEFTGFIPCAHHARQILEKKITIESLIKDRKPGILPFPLYAKY